MAELIELVLYYIRAMRENKFYLDTTSYSIGRRDAVRMVCKSQKMKSVLYSESGHFLGKAVIVEKWSIRFDSSLLPGSDAMPDMRIANRCVISTRLQNPHGTAIAIAVHTRSFCRSWPASQPTGMQACPPPNRSPFQAPNRNQSALN